MKRAPPKKRPAQSAVLKPSPESPEAVFHAFQSNLLSLISHELRTPLTGILNAVTLLEEGRGATPLSTTELLSMVRRNAQRLEASLGSLLDLAAIEVGMFHLRLREIELFRFMERKTEMARAFLEAQGLGLRFEGEAASASGKRRSVLADPQKLGRVLDLCFQSLISRAGRGTNVDIHVTDKAICISFSIPEAHRKEWQKQWKEGSTTKPSELSKLGSVFLSTLQSQEGFLSRDREGLEVELILIHEIIRRHGGQFECHLESREPGWVGVELEITLPELSSQTQLLKALNSRSSQVTQELSSISLGLIRVPQGREVGEFRDALQRALFRSTDAVYALPEKKLLALLMDDCKPQDAPRLVERIQKQLKTPLDYGLASAPEDGTDAEILFETALERLG